MVAAHDCSSASIKKSRCLGYAAQAMAVLQNRIPQILGWLATFRRPVPDDNAAVDLGWEHPPEAVAVCGVADIEESVWAPRYGLKGMVDASVELRFRPLHGPRPGQVGCFG